MAGCFKGSSKPDVNKLWPLPVLYKTHAKNVLYVLIGFFFFIKIKEWHTAEIICGHKPKIFTALSTAHVFAFSCHLYQPYSNRITWNCQSPDKNDSYQNIDFFFLINHVVKVF